MHREKLMKKTISVLLSVFLIASLWIPVYAENEFDGILTSDLTAIDYLEGYWTNRRSDYIYASRGDSELINWQTNLPYPVCSIYVLENGVFKGKSLNTNSEIEEYEIFSIRIIDDDSIEVKSFISGEESVFTRDSFTVDPENLSDSYVFRTMERAVSFLNGEWMTGRLDYLDVSVDVDGNIGFHTNLPCENGDTMDFCDGEMCSISFAENGKKSFEKAYGFHIVDKDTVSVRCYSDGKDYLFYRTSAEVDPDNLNSDYVFFCSSRAYAFLEGNWKEKDGENYFTLENDNGNITWKTSIPLEKHYYYLFANGGLLGVDYDEDGNRSTKALYTLRVISRDEMTIFVISEKQTYRFERQQISE